MGSWSKNLKFVIDLAHFSRIPASCRCHRHNIVVLHHVHRHWSLGQLAFLAVIAFFRQLVAAWAMLFAFICVNVAVFVAEIIAALVVMAFVLAFVARAGEMVLSATFVTFLEPVAFFAALVTSTIGRFASIFMAAAWAVFKELAHIATVIASVVAAMLFAARIALDYKVAFFAALLTTFFAILVEIAISIVFAIILVVMLF